jgi:protease-4
MQKRTAWFLVASLAAVAVGAAALGGLALVLRGGGGSPFGSGSYLMLHLQGEIPEQSPSELAGFIERRPPSLRVLVDSLDRAGSDPKVKAAVIRLSVLPDAGWGKAQELRDAILRFRKHDKPVYAHLEFCGNKEYYLASACTKVYAVPTALLDVTGLAAEVTFFRGTLDKLGIEAQFEGVGKYKNAPNQYTEKGFTEPHREQMSALVDSIYRQYVSAIAEGRRMKPEQVEALLNDGPYDARTAQKAGLVDELLYQDQLDDRLKGSDKVTPVRYVRKSRGFGLDGRSKVALIYAVGEITGGESQTTPFGGEYMGADTIAAALKHAREDDDIKAIVMRVDSPGGEGTASEVIWREVELAKKEKPVVISMGDVAASGGYYIAMGSDAIVAQPGTITGSIGVYGGKLTLKGLYEKVGVSKEILTRGRHAALFSDYRPWDDEERGKIRVLMTDFYRDFVRRAAEGRKKSFDELHALAQGRVWTGTEALEHGLVDDLGGLEVALKLAKQKAKLGDEEVRLVVLPEPKGLIDTLLQRQEESAQAAIPVELRSLLRWASLLRAGSPLTRLPFELRIR